MDKNDLTTAFSWPSLPCNPRPFLTQLTEGVKANGTGWINTDHAKGLLMTLMLQAYDGITPDLFNEFSRLTETLNVKQL